MKILVINGPNLNLLGKREPEVYGERTYSELEEFICKSAAGAGIEIRQSNHEGEIVEWIQRSVDEGFEALVINAAAYTHSSIAILDAIRAVGIRTVEVHLTDIAAREEFRRVSYVGMAAEAVFKGKGFQSYAEAIGYLLK